MLLGDQLRIRFSLVVIDIFNCIKLIAMSIFAPTPQKKQIIHIILRKNYIENKKSIWVRIERLLRVNVILW